MERERSARDGDTSARERDRLIEERALELAAAGVPWLDAIAQASRALATTHLASQNESGWSYEYRVPKAGGGTEIKSVQQQTLDRSHPGQGHWEAGKVKVDPDTGKIRYNKYGRPKLDGTKSKVDYDE